MALSQYQVNIAVYRDTHAKLQKLKRDDLDTFDIIINRLLLHYNPEYAKTVQETMNKAERQFKEKRSATVQAVAAVVQKLPSSKKESSND